MPSTATAEDVASRWRPLEAAEQDVAFTLLEDAWTLILQHIPDLDDQITAGTILQSTVTMVQARMVLRVLKNPDGFRQASIDDWSYTRDQTLSAGELYLSDDELAMLDGPTATAAAFSIRPYGEPGFTADSGSWYS